MPRYTLIECRRGGCNDDPRSLEAREVGAAGPKKKKKEESVWGLGFGSGGRDGGGDGATSERASERKGVKKATLLR